MVNHTYGNLAHRHQEKTKHESGNPHARVECQRIPTARAMTFAKNTKIMRIRQESGPQKNMQTQAGGTGNLRERPKCKDHRKGARKGKKGIEKGPG